jgi:putative SOS response-associated peptidase YedK
MIDRYSLSVPADKLSKYAQNLPSKGYSRSYNIHPLKKASIFINHGDKPALVQGIWGLLPHFSKEMVNRGNLYNAYFEGVASKPSFRIPIRQRRCLIPADSYYIKCENQWHRVMKRDRSVMLLAGLYDVIQLDKHQYLSYSMITVPPNRDLASLKHNMPIAMCASTESDWLNPNTPLNDIIAMLKCSDNYQWIHYPIKDTLELDKYDAPDIHDEYMAERTLFDLV